MKKCRVCRAPADTWLIPPRNSLARTCSMACALDDVGLEKAKEFKKETRVMKAKLLDRDHKFWKAKAQKVFNEFVRLDDAEEDCISCDKTKYWDGQWHAGHYKTVGARSDLRFNRDNCNKQCSVCNNYLSGNLAVYRLKLTARIGISRVEALELDCSNVKHMRVEDYKAIYEEYRTKLKHLRAIGE